MDLSNESRKKDFDFIDQQVLPLKNQYDDLLNEKFLKSDIPKNMGEDIKFLFKRIKTKKEIFNEKNLELMKKVSKLETKTGEIQGALTMHWKGQEIPLSEAKKLLRSNNRAERKEAYESRMRAVLSISDEIDGIFDELVELRHQIAQNAGFDYYTPYRFKELKREDWGETECFNFHQAVKKLFLPIKDRLVERRKKTMKLDTLYSYDLLVDPNGNAPIKIYEKGEESKLLDGVEKVLKDIDVSLLEMYQKINRHNLIDFESRKNKAPMGYMTKYPNYGLASVFFNGTGLVYDFFILIHELGHCFHYLLSKDKSPFGLQEWTQEVAEAGSISMEYIGLEKLNLLLEDDDCFQRVKNERLELIVDIFIDCSKVDEFQHWIYKNPKHKSEERHQKWAELSRVYHDETSDYEEEKSKTSWQFVHILQAPFYYIDYAISELLAIHLWAIFKKDPSHAIALYKDGCSLGGSRSVPEIYNAFGANLDFSENALLPISQMLEKELGLTS